MSASKLALTGAGNQVAAGGMATTDGSRVGSLETLCVERLCAELRSRESIYFAADLPGVLCNIGLPDAVLKEVWRRLSKDEDGQTRLGKVPWVRPFYGAGLLHDLTLRDVSDALAREINAVHFPALRSLRIQSSPTLSDAGFSRGPATLNTLVRLELAECPKVSAFAVSQCLVRDSLVLVQSLRQEKQVPSDFLLGKKEVTLNGGNPGLLALVDSFTKQLAKSSAPNLRSLTISDNSKANDMFVAALVKGAPSLSKLNLFFCDVTANGFMELAQLPNLEELSLMFCDINFTDHLEDPHELEMACLSFPKLHTLDISGADFGVEGESIALSCFAHIPHLRLLHARKCNLKFKKDQRGLNAVLSKVTKLDLAENPLEDVAFRNDDFLTFESLEHLDLSDTLVKSPPLLNPRTFPELKSLVFDRSAYIQDGFFREVLLGEEGISQYLSYASFVGCPNVTAQLLQDIAISLAIPFNNHEANGNSWRKIDARHVDLGSESHFLSGFVRHFGLKLASDPTDHTIRLLNEGVDMLEDVDNIILRRFVHGMDEYSEETFAQNSSANSKPPISTKVASGSVDLNGEAIPSSIHVKQSLQELCCTCRDCAAAHPNVDVFPKLRYTKDELLALKPSVPRPCWENVDIGELPVTL